MLQCCRQVILTTFLDTDPYTMQMPAGAAGVQMQMLLPPPETPHRPPPRPPPHLRLPAQAEAARLRTRTLSTGFTMSTFRLVNPCSLLLAEPPMPRLDCIRGCAFSLFAAGLKFRVYALAPRTSQTRSQVQVL